MSRRKTHIEDLPLLLEGYADKRSLDFQQYSPYHYRLMDGGYTVLDVWTTGRYFVLTTDYAAMLDYPVVERASEKGQLAANKLGLFLDNLFYPEGLGVNETK